MLPKSSKDVYLIKVINIMCSCIEYHSVTLCYHCFIIQLYKEGTNYQLPINR